MQGPNLSNKNRKEIQTLINKGDTLQIETIFNNSTFQDFLEYVESVERSHQNGLKKVHDARDERSQEIETLRNEIKNFEQVIAQHENDLTRMKETAIEGCKEILHANLDPNRKHRLVNTLTDGLNANEISTLDADITGGFFVSSRITDPISATSGPDSVMARPYTENRVRTSYLPCGTLWAALDKPSTTADTIRTHHNRHSLSIAVCDGAGAYGDASRIYSRIISTLIVEKLPLSNSSAILFQNNPTANAVVDCLRHKERKLKSPLLRTLDLQSFNHFNLESGKATALNLIVQSNGYFWHSGVGDTCLLKLTEVTDGLHELSSLYETANDSDETRMIGYRHGNSPQTFVPERENQRLSEGDFLIAMTDHVAKFASENQDIFKHGVLSIINSKNKSQQVHAWDDLLSQIEKLENDDDSSMLIFKPKGEFVQIPAKDIIDISRTSVKYKGERFNKSKKDYYVGENRSNGLKRIPLISASNLLTLKHEYVELPRCFPRYEIVQHQENLSDFFIVMEHLSDENYLRLDNAIYQLETTEDVDRLLMQVKGIERQLAENNLSHGDFAPTNIFVSKNGLQPSKIIDLNTVYFQGAFPHTSERGHPGMHGNQFLPAIPSLHAHKFAFEVLKFTLKIIRCHDRQGIESFVRNHIDASADETYLLDGDLLDVIFLDDQGEREGELIDRIQEMYPLIAVEEIRLFLSNARMSNIFTF